MNAACDLCNMAGVLFGQHQTSHQTSMVNFQAPDFLAEAQRTEGGEGVGMRNKG